MTKLHVKKIDPIHASTADLEQWDVLEHPADKGIVVDPVSKLRLLETDRPRLREQATKVPSKTGSRWKLVG
jgi:hypothetical protein